MFSYILSFFKKNKTNEESVDQIEYKTMLSLENNNTKDAEEIIIPIVPKNDNINFIIMDDNETAAEITLEELEHLSTLANMLKHGKISEFPTHDQEFIGQLNTEDLKKLYSFDISKYNIILCTGKMAGFKVIKLLENGIKIDVAFLDLIMGGYNTYHGKGTIIDGIDVANELLNYNPDTTVLFYSGCALDEQSGEYNKANRLLNIDIKNQTVGKDNNYLEKQSKLLSLLVY